MTKRLNLRAELGLLLLALLGGRALGIFGFDPDRLDWRDEIVTVASEFIYAARKEEYVRGAFFMQLHPVLALLQLPDRHAKR